MGFWRSALLGYCFLTGQTAWGEAAPLSKEPAPALRVENDDTKFFRKLVLGIEAPDRIKIGREAHVRITLGATNPGYIADFEGRAELWDGTTRKLSRPVSIRVKDDLPAHWEGESGYLYIGGRSRMLQQTLATLRLQGELRVRDAAGSEVLKRSVAMDRPVEFTKNWLAQPLPMAKPGDASLPEEVGRRLDRVRVEMGDQPGKVRFTEVYALDEHFEAKQFLSGDLFLRFDDKEIPIGVYAVRMRTGGPERPVEYAGPIPMRAQIVARSNPIHADTRDAIERPEELHVWQGMMWKKIELQTADDTWSSGDVSKIRCMYSNVDRPIESRAYGFELMDRTPGELIAMLEGNGQIQRNDAIWEILRRLWQRETGASTGELGGFVEPLLALHEQPDAHTNPQLADALDLYRKRGELTRAQIQRYFKGGLSGAWGNKIELTDWPESRERRFWMPDPRLGRTSELRVARQLCLKGEDREYGDSGSVRTADLGRNSPFAQLSVPATHQNNQPIVLVTVVRDADDAVLFELREDVSLPDRAAKD